MSDKALLVEVKVILIPGLIKITNINAYLEWSGNKWAFSANGVKPNQMIGNHLGSLGVTVKKSLKNAEQFLSAPV